MTLHPKLWISDALNWLQSSLLPVPHEINELDWKAQLSDHKDRLAEHLMAFANLANGGFLVFGVHNADASLQPVNADDVAHIVNTLVNIGRDAVEPPLVIDHAVVDYQNVPLLFVRVPEQANKPAHRRGKSIEEAWIRSGGTTRKASRPEIANLMLHSQAPRWEELRASGLLSLNEVVQQLDLPTIAKLLERPLPANDAELANWMVGEHLITPDGTGYYI
ncbi:MAG: helix-turn-helix domain-containing protein, partial [Polaromonas sp.]